MIAPSDSKMLAVMLAGGLCAAAGAQDLAPALATPPGTVLDAGMAGAVVPPDATINTGLNDGMFDMSDFLDKPYGFIPVVMPITEPAVGAGLAVVPVFINKPAGGGKPDIAGAGAMRTSNGSEGFFGGYSGYFDDQKLHVLAAVMKMSVNLDFYSLGSSFSHRDDPLRYNLDVTGGLVGFDHRLGDSRFSMGLKYFYANVDATFADPVEGGLVTGPDYTDEFGDPGLHAIFSLLQPSIMYDSRDNIFTPTRGVYGELNLSLNSEALGGSVDFQMIKAEGLWYEPLENETLFLAVRAQVKQSFGDVPFYARPSVELRGLPALSVQGEGVAFTEAELRWQFDKRWSVVGFGGVGCAWADDSPFSNSHMTYTGGGGIRYLIAERYGLHMGVDVAWSEEGPAVYIQFGSAWMRP